METTLTAKPAYYLRRIGYNTLVYELICKCFEEPRNAAGVIYCPIHGTSYKLLDGTIIRKQS